MLLPLSTFILGICSLFTPSLALILYRNSGELVPVGLTDVWGLYSTQDPRCLSLDYSKMEQEEWQQIRGIIIENLSTEQMAQILSLPFDKKFTEGEQQLLSHIFNDRHQRTISKAQKPKTNRKTRNANNSKTIAQNPSKKRARDDSFEPMTMYAQPSIRFNAGTNHVEHVLPAKTAPLTFAQLFPTVPLPENLGVDEAISISSTLNNLSVKDTCTLLQQLIQADFKIPPILMLLLSPTKVFACRMEPAEFPGIKADHFVQAMMPKSPNLKTTPLPSVTSDLLRLQLLRLWNLPAGEPIVIFREASQSLAILGQEPRLPLQYKQRIQQFRNGVQDLLATRLADRSSHGEAAILAKLIRFFKTGKTAL